MSELAQVVMIEKQIFSIRGMQVMLERNLAERYEVETHTPSRTGQTQQ